MTEPGGMVGRITRAVGAGAVGQVLSIVGRLLLVPLFLVSWGAHTYGEWLILSSAAAWLAVCDFGAQSYCVNRLTMEWARGDLHGFERTAATGFVIFLIIPGCLLGILGPLLIYAPVNAWLGILATPLEITRVVLFLFAAQIVMTIPQGLLQGLYRATGKQATSAMISMALLAVQLAASYAVLLAGGGMRAMALAQVLPSIPLGIWMVFDLRRRFGCVNPFRFGNARWHIAREAVSPSLSFLAIQFAQAMVVQGSVIVVGRSLGAVDAALFSTVRTVLNLARQFLALLGHSAWPEITRLAEQGNFLRLKVLLTSILRLSLLLSLAYIAVMEVAGRYLLETWLLGKLPYDVNLVRSFSVYLLLSVFWNLLASVFMATNTHQALARWQCVYAVAAIVLCYYGAITWGVSGGVAGLILGEALPLSLVATGMLARMKKGVFRPEGLAGEVALPLAVAACLFVNLPVGLLLCGGTGVYVVRAVWRDFRDDCGNNSIHRKLN